MAVSYLFFFIIIKIYLFEREREREAQAEGSQGEGERIPRLLHIECGARCGVQFQDPEIIT